MRKRRAFSVLCCSVPLAFCPSLFLGAAPERKVSVAPAQLLARGEWFDSEALMLHSSPRKADRTQLDSALNLSNEITK